MNEYQWPIEGGHVITAGWWYPGGGLHRAIDVRCPEGTEVRAMRDGTIAWYQNWDGVTKIGNQSYGNAIKIQHDDGTFELMAHFSRFAEETIKTGQRVKQGQLIAYSGSTGNSTGPHLHIEMRDQNNERLHPLDYLPGPIEYASDTVKEYVGTFTSPTEEPQEELYNINLTLGPVKEENMKHVLALIDAMGHVNYTISKA